MEKIVVCRQICVWHSHFFVKLNLSLNETTVNLSLLSLFYLFILNEQKLVWE